MSDNLPVIQAALNKARKDKFELVLTLPNILKKLNNRNTRENEYLNLDSLQFSVYGVNVPTIEVPAHSLHYSGQNYNITSFDRPAYPPASVKFTVDNEYKNYWVIWKWLQLLNDPNNSTFGRPDIFKGIGGYPEVEPQILYDYTTLVTLRALDEYNNAKIEFEFKYAFVTRLGDFSYDYRDPEEIECNFDFVYNQLDMRLI